MLVVRKLLFRVFVGVVFCAVIYAADSSFAAEPVKISPGIAARMRTVRAEIVSGRIQLVGTRSRGSSTSTTRSGSRTERLSIDARGERPAIQYELKTPKRWLRIAAVGQGRLEISHHVQGSSEDENEVLEFKQQPNQRLSLALSNAQQSVTAQAAGLWHLQLSQPALCRQHLNPLLQLLRADWNLAETADAVEKTLLEQATVPNNGPRQHWQALVDQLASDQFSRRRAADRQLRAAGTAVVPFLQTLDRGDLDAEQWFRVRRILASYSGGNDVDTPLLIARRLVNDPRVWHSLLERDDPRCQQQAVKHLSRLLGEPIQYDPQADAATRQRLIDDIGSRIAPKTHDE